MSSSKKKSNEICAACKVSLICLSVAGAILRCCICNKTVCRIQHVDGTREEFIIWDICPELKKEDSSDFCVACFNHTWGRLGVPSGIKDPKEDPHDDEA